VGLCSHPHLVSTALAGRTTIKRDERIADINKFFFINLSFFSFYPIVAANSSALINAGEATAQSRNPYLFDCEKNWSSRNCCLWAGD
jgi:hypothetical protein